MKGWIAAKGYEGLFEINRLGEVRSLYKGHFQKKIFVGKTRTDYVTVRLSIDGAQKRKYLHRLLAENFIPNPENKCCVNHINGDKLDNRLENLEWMTIGENIRHASKLGLMKGPCKAVIDTCTKIVYSSITEAAKALSIKKDTLKKYLSGRIKFNPTCIQYLLT